MNQPVLEKSSHKRSHSPNLMVLSKHFRGFFRFFGFGHQQKTTKNTKSFNAKAPKPKSRRRSNKTWLEKQPLKLLMSWWKHDLFSSSEIDHNKKCVYLKKKARSHKHHTEKTKRKVAKEPCLCLLLGPLCCPPAEVKLFQGIATSCQEQQVPAQPVFFSVGPNSGSIWKTKTCKVKGALRPTSILLLAGWFLPS